MGFVELLRKHVSANSIQDHLPPKRYSRHQKKLRQMLRCNSSSQNTANKTSGTSLSNQNALMQLIRQHPQVCQVMYDFSFEEDDNITRVTGDQSTSTKQKSHNNRLQYPLGRLLEMPSLPSTQLLYTAHQAYPMALHRADAEGQNVLHSLCANAGAGRTESKTLISLMRYILAAAPSLVTAPTRLLSTTPLHAAVRFGASLEVVHLLAEAHPETLLATTSNGETPLHCACQNVDLLFASALIPYLLRLERVQVLATNKQGESALHILLQSHRQDSNTDKALSSSSRTRSATHLLLQIVQKLLEHDATQTLLRMPDAFERVPLHVALSFGSYPLEVIQFLVQQQPQSICVRDVGGVTPVHLASLYPAQLDILQYLLQVKLAANKHDQLSEVPRGKENVKGYRYDRGDDISRYTSMTSTSSSSLSSSDTKHIPAVCQTWVHPGLSPGVEDKRISGREDLDVFDANAILNELLDNYDECHRTSFAHTIKAVRSVDCHDDDGNDELPNPALRVSNSSNALPLHLACEFWTSLAVVKALVDHDPQTLRKVDAQACTPLHLACASLAPFEILQYLVQKHPEALYMRDNQSRLPLHVAVELLPPHCPLLSAVLELLLGVELLWLRQEEVYDTSDLKQGPTFCTSIRQATNCRGETAFNISVRRHTPIHILLLLAPRYGDNERVDPVHRYKRRPPPVQQIQVPTPVIETTSRTINTQRRVEI